MLAGIIPLHISFHFSSDPWLSEVPCHQLCCFLCSPTGILWYSQITFAFNFLSLGTYTFFSFNIRPSFWCYSSSLNIFTPVHFISSIAFTTSSSLASYFFTLSSKSTPSIITSTDGDGKGNLSVDLICRGERGFWIRITMCFTILTKVDTTKSENQNLQVIPQLCAIK